MERDCLQWHVVTGQREWIQTEGQCTIGGKFFSFRVVRHLKGLPGEVVGASSPEVFKTRWDGALSNLVKGEVTLSIQRGLKLHV